MEEFNFDMNMFNEHIRNMAKEYDKFLFENLDKIENKFVGYKIKPTIPTMDNTMINECSIKCSNVYQFIGFDNFEEKDHWLKEGYSICEKSDLEKVRGLL